MANMPNIEETIGFALHHSSYLFKTALKDIFAANQIDITPEEMILLFMLSPSGTEQGHLVEKSLKDKTNVARLLSRMEKKALIRRESHSESARQQMVFITKKGGAIRETALPLVQKMVKNATEGISVSALDTTQNTLTILTQNLQKLTS